MFSVIPNRKNYCLYFTVCAHYPRLPNVFSSNVRSSKYLIITELICSKALKPELSKARIAQMLELPNAPKGLNARIVQCSIAQCSKPPNVQKALCLVKIQNSKIQNCGTAATIQNSKLKIQKSPHNLLHLVNVSVERSAMFEFQRTHGGSKLASLCYALAL